MAQQIEWPKKTHEVQTWAMDSTYWNDFKFRDDDIIIATWAKSGTTWLQQIVAQLIFKGDTHGLPIGEMSPWVDFRLPPLEARDDLEEQTHRRFLKTHLPIEALVYSPKAKYIYIARDGRDCIWSLFNHHHALNDMFYGAINSIPDFGTPLGRPDTDDPRQYFLDWFNDKTLWWSFWENIRGWWAVRDLPNLHFLHFQSMKEDLEGEMRRLADFLEIPIDESKWEQMVYHASFDYMKKNATLSTPLGGAIFEGGADSFVYKGTNNRWHDALSAEEVAAYEARAVKELGEECAHWLATGKFLE